METVYQKKHDMGGWSRGTPVAIIKKMEKMVMDVRRHASEEGADMAGGHVPPRRRGKGKGKGQELEDEYEEEDGEEEEGEEGEEGEEVAPMDLPPASIRRRRRLSIIVDTPEQSSTTVSPSPPARNQDSPDSPPPIKKARLVSVVPPPRTPTSREAEKRPTTILHYFPKQPVAEMTRDAGLAGPRPKNSLTHDNPTTDNDTDDSRTKRVWVPRVKSPATEHKHRRKASSLSRSRASTVSSDELLSAHAPTPLTSVAAIRAPSKGLASHRPKSTTTPKLIVKKPRKMKRLSQPGASAPAPVTTADEWEVERIVRHRFRDSQKEYLVKWLGFPDSDNS